MTGPGPPLPAPEIPSLRTGRPRRSGGFCSAGPSRPEGLGLGLQAGPSCKTEFLGRGGGRSRAVDPSPTPSGPWPPRTRGLRGPRGPGDVPAGPVWGGPDGPSVRRARQDTTDRQNLGGAAEKGHIDSQGQVEVKLRPAEGPRPTTTLTPRPLDPTDKTTPEVLRHLAPELDLRRQEVQGTSSPGRRGGGRGWGVRKRGAEGWSRTRPRCWGSPAPRWTP